MRTSPFVQLTNPVYAFIQILINFTLIIGPAKSSEMSSSADFHRTEDF